jgi:hypothetical protein
MNKSFPQLHYLFFFIMFLPITAFSDDDKVDSIIEMVEETLGLSHNESTQFVGYLDWFITQIQNGFHDLASGETEEEQKEKIIKVLEKYYFTPDAMVYCSSTQTSKVQRYAIKKYLLRLAGDIQSQYRYHHIQVWYLPDLELSRIWPYGKNRFETMVSTWQVFRALNREKMILYEDLTEKRFNFIFEEIEKNVYRIRLSSITVGETKHLTRDEKESDDD